MTGNTRSFPNVIPNITTTKENAMTTIDFTKYPDVVKTLACPQCGSEDLATIEEITGTARAQITTNGVDYAGETEIHWESSTTIGVQCHERECEWFYVGKDWQDQLAVVGEEEAAERAFTLTVTLNIDAKTPEDAAIEARRMLSNGEQVFVVHDDDGYVGWYDGLGQRPEVG